MTQLSAQTVKSLFIDPSQGNQLTHAQWSQFIFILRECDLLGRFYYLAREHECYDLFPNKVKHHLHSAKVKADRQAKQAIYEAVELGENLTEIDVHPIFLKGVAYTLRNSSASKGRVYSDMDVLVAKSQLKEVERRLSIFGWFVKDLDEYDQKYYRQWAHEIPPMQQHSRGTVADIHHNLLPPISGRAPDITMFTNHLHSTETGLFTLSKPAMVLHSIIHLFFNEEFSNGFRDLTDLHLMFSEEDEKSDFWPELSKLSEQVKFTTELYYAVRYCQLITETQFPDSFLTLVNQAKLNPVKLAMADFLFSKVLLPHHPSCMDKYTSIARVMAEIRGHLLKMPLHILIYHSLYKVFNTVMTSFKKDKITDRNTIQNAINKRG